MDNSTLIPMIVLGLGVIFFFLAAFLGSKTWRVTHIVLATFVFFASIVFCYSAARFLKMNQAWGEVANRLHEELAQQREDNRILEFGDPDEPDSVENSRRSLAAQAARDDIYRGRVWRNVQPVSASPQEVKINTANWGDSACCNLSGSGADLEGGDEGGDEGEAPAKPELGITEKMVLYLFKETKVNDLSDEKKQILYGESQWYLKDTQGVCRVPTDYLGQFQVVSTGATLTLRPSVPLNNAQLTAIQDTSGTWVLYESLPADGHEAMAGLDEQQLRTLLPQAALGVSDGGYAAILQEYLRDGEKAADGDLAERVWVKVRFLKDHTITVDVEESELANDRFFDPAGRAVVSGLRQNDESKYDEGKEAVFSMETARQLIADGVCEEVERVYRRPLRDYAFMFRDVFERAIALEDQITVVVRDTEVVAGTLVKARAQVTYRDGEKGELTGDLAKFKYEQEQLTQYLEALDAQYQQVRGQLSALYRSNGELAKELGTVQRAQAQKINERTDQASIAVDAGPVTQ